MTDTPVTTDSPQRAAQFFDGFAETFDTIYDGKRGPFMRWFDRQFRSDMVVRYEKTFERFGDLHGKSVLDVGCGSGPYVVEAFRRGAERVTALDPAPNMLTIVKSRLAGSPFVDRCNYVEGIFPGPRVEPHDHAIVMGVMDYVEDAQAFLKALAPLFTNSAAISFPSKHWLRTPLRAVRYKLRNCPLFFYDEAKIRRLAEGAGISKITIDKIAGAGQDYHVWLRK